SLEKEARKYEVSLKKVAEEEYQRAASDYGCAQVDDLYADIGYGKLGARQVLSKLAPSVPVRFSEPSRISSTIKRALGLSRDAAIQVHGYDDLLVYRAKCCNPIRGEEIVGYITRGKGVAVHSVQCKNVQNLMYEAERKIDVDWARSASEPLPVKIMIFTDDRPGILHQLTSV